MGAEMLEHSTVDNSLPRHHWLNMGIQGGPNYPFTQTVYCPGCAWHIEIRLDVPYDELVRFLGTLEPCGVFTNPTMPGWVVRDWVDDRAHLPSV